MSSEVLNQELEIVTVAWHIDLLAILQKSLDRALLSWGFVREVRSSGARASITIVHIRKSYRIKQTIVRL